MTQDIKSYITGIVTGVVIYYLLCGMWGCVSEMGADHVRIRDHERRLTNIEKDYEKRIIQLEQSKL